MIDTEFTNHLVPLEHIPDVGQASFQPLEPAYLTVRRITFAILFVIALVGVIAIFVFNPKARLWWAMLGAGGGLSLLSVLYLVADTWSFRLSGYALREHDLVYKKGWWVRVQKIVPFNRVQHLSLESGLIERKYGLACLHIYTAGSAQADFTLRGVKQEVAEKLKDWITNHIQDHTPENTQAHIQDNPENESVEPNEPLAS